MSDHKLTVLEFPKEVSDPSYDVTRVLDGAVSADLAKVIIVGVTQDGDFYIASSESFPQTVATLEMGKFYMHHMLFEEGEIDAHCG